LQAVEDKYGSVIKINQGLKRHNQSAQHTDGQIVMGLLQINTYLQLPAILQLYSQVDELKCPKQTKGKHVLLLHKGR
jgi:hypothetical protein